MAQNNIAFNARNTFNLDAGVNAATDSLGSGSVVVFDRRFWTKVPPLGALALEVRLLYDGSQNFTVSFTISWGAHSFNWSRQFNGDFTWRIGLFADFAAEMDVANWNTTATQLTGNLVLKITGPLGIHWTKTEPINVPLPNQSEIGTLSRATLENFQALASFR